MKAFKRLIFSILLLVGVGYVLFAIVFNIPFFQKKIATETSRIIERQIGTPIRIERIIFQPINQVELKNVYLKDRTANTLFAAKSISINFDIFSAFKHSFRIYSAHIHTFSCHLTREKLKAPLNIQYIIEAFKKSQKQKNHASMRIYVQNFSLKNGCFSYKINDQKNTTNRFNPFDIQLDKVNANFRLKKGAGTNLEAEIFRFNFVEKSGLQVKNLSCRLLVKNRTTKINQIILHLPISRIKAKNFVADYSQNKPQDNFFEKTHFELQIQPSIISLKEMKIFSPTLCNLAKSLSLEIKGRLTGNSKNLQISQFSVRENRHIKICASLNLTHLNFSHPSNIFIQTHIQKAFISSFGVQWIIKKLNLNTKYISKITKKIGKISFKGNFTGKPNHWISDLKVQTQTKNFRTIASFEEKGSDSFLVKVSTSNICLNKKFNKNLHWNLNQLELNFNSTFTKWRNEKKGSIEGFVKGLKYKSFSFETIDLTGDLSLNNFEGILNIKSPEGQITTKGTFVFKEENFEYNFLATLSKVILNKEHPISKYKNLTLSCQATVLGKGNRLEDFVGNIAFQNLQFCSNTFYLPFSPISIEMGLKGKNKKQWIISSNILNGTIEGNFSLKTIWKSIEKSISTYLPSLFSIEHSPIEDRKNDLECHLMINNIENISKAFHLPFNRCQPIYITGMYKELPNQLRLNVNCPSFNIKNHTIKNLTFHLTNQNHRIEITGNGSISHLQEKNTLNTSIHFISLNDSIFSSIHWKNQIGNPDSGQLNFMTTFSTSSDTSSPIKTITRIYPSTFIYNQIIWETEPTTVTYSKKQIYTEKFVIKHNEQVICIKGFLSEQKNKPIEISLENVDLNFIQKLLSLNILDFDGKASGRIELQDIFHEKKLSADLHVDQFSLNKTILGNLTISGQWEDGKNRVSIKGKIVKAIDEYILISGCFVTIKQKIDLLFDSHKTNIAFLQKYFNKTFSDFSGQLTGKIHLFGPLHEVNIKGKAWIQNGGFKIKFLNTNYTFNDWITCTPHKISVQNFYFYDKYKNKIQMNASIHHDSFNHFKFEADFNCNNVLIYNANQQTNPTIYGTVFATGKCFMRGDERLISINSSLSNDKNSQLFLSFIKKGNEIEECDFIHFINKNKIDENQKRILAIDNFPINTEIQLNLFSSINDKATLEIITDPNSNNKILLTGNGNFQIQYGTKTPLRVFGKYTVTSGLYNFNLKQAAFSRNFNITNGSSIIFDGDPMKGELNAKSYYSVSADLSNLNRTEIQLSSDSSNRKQVNSFDHQQIPINCVILVSGLLENPIVKFDLELPESNIELDRQIKNHIRNEDIDMMNNQILYLLITGHFYDLEFTKNEIKLKNNLSLLTSTLSSQISNLLNSFNDKIKINTNLNILPSPEWKNKNTVKFDFLFSSLLLNDQLMIKNHIKYIDSEPLHWSSINDFDIEYKLWNNKNIWIKGFNHCDYKNHTVNSSIKMTQGIGIFFQKEI